jgi:hypothetical protein
MNEIMRDMEDNRTVLLFIVIFDRESIFWASIAAIQEQYLWMDRKQYLALDLRYTPMGQQIYLRKSYANCIGFRNQKRKGPIF